MLLQPASVTTSPGLPQSALEWGHSHCANGRCGQDLGLGGLAFALKLPELLNTNLAAVREKLGQTSCFPNGPLANLVPNNAINLGAKLGPVRITKLSPNWACQMGPIHCLKFLLSGPYPKNLTFIHQNFRRPSFSHLHQHPYYLLRKISQWRFLAVSSYMLHYAQMIRFLQNVDQHSL